MRGEHRWKCVRGLCMSLCLKWVYVREGTAAVAAATHMHFPPYAGVFVSPHMKEFARQTEREYQLSMLSFSLIHSSFSLWPKTEHHCHHASVSPALSIPLSVSFSGSDQGAHHTLALTGITVCAVLVSPGSCPSNLLIRVCVCVYVLWD